ncbi:MAG: hypothetical protein RSB32_00985, partial [Mucinivorans sp.]
RYPQNKYFSFFEFLYSQDLLESVLICFQNFITAIFEAVFSMISRDSSGLQIKNQRKKRTKRVAIKCWKEIKTDS